MKTFYKVLLVAAPLTVISFFLSRIIWPGMPGMVGPTAAQLPFFIFLSALESVSFGLGVAFVLFGWPHLRSVTGPSMGLTKAAFIGIAWLLISWWPHDNMHRVNGMGDFTGLLRIEFIFHFTLILAGFVLARFFWELIARRSLA